MAIHSAIVVFGQSGLFSTQDIALQYLATEFLFARTARIFPAVRTKTQKLANFIIGIFRAKRGQKKI